MAAKTPVTDNTTSGHTVAGLSVYGGVNAINAALLSNGTHKANRNGLQLSIFHFADVDDDGAADTWTSNIPNIAAVAWQADQADADQVAVTLTIALDGVVTFQGPNTNNVGWLWVLHGT